MTDTPQTTKRIRHEWGPSRVGHGEAQCIHCLMTNREAWVLGDFCLTQGPSLIVYTPSRIPLQWQEIISNDQP